MSEQDEAERTEHEVGFFENDGNEKEEVDNSTSCYNVKKIIRKKSSILWNKFSILSHERSIAACDICGQKLSFKSTVTNLKKHLERKHNYNSSNRSFRPNSYKIKREPSSDSAVHRPTGSLKRKTLTELSGLDGLILNVVAEDGEHPLADTELQAHEMEEVYTSTGEEIHDYCLPNGDGNEELRENQTRYASSPHKTHTSQRTQHYDKSEKARRNQIMDLQLECLEIKKYTMQMEALILERQLNLPRSLFTETLTEAETRERGTQTDIKGNNTKVFYVSDGSGVNRNSSQHFFTFQASLDE